MNPDIKDFYQFTVDDFELRNYKYGQDRYSGRNLDRVRSERHEHHSSR